MTAFSGQILAPKLWKVMIDSLSEGVRVYIRTFIVYFTKSIFSPLIDPLTSITQIRSTLVLEPPLEVTEHIAGKTVNSPNLTWDLCATKDTSTFGYWPISFTLSLFSLKGSSSLKMAGSYVGFPAV